MAGHRMILNFTFFGMRPRKSITHTPVVAERARRFMNLVVDVNSEPERGRSASAQPRRTTTNALVTSFLRLARQIALVG
jgi:hypothetical protein